MIDNFDEKTEKPLEPVANLSTRDLVRFALRLEPTTLDVEQTEQWKLSPSNQLLSLAFAKSDIVTKKIRFVPRPSDTPKARPATQNPLPLRQNRHNQTTSINRIEWFLSVV